MNVIAGLPMRGGSDSDRLHPIYKKLPARTKEIMAWREDEGRTERARVRAESDHVFELTDRIDARQSRINDLNRSKARGGPFPKVNEQELLELAAENAEDEAKRAKLTERKAHVSVPKEQRAKLRFAHEFAPAEPDFFLACGPRANFVTLQAELKGGASLKALAASRERSKALAEALIANEKAPLDLATQVFAMERGVDKTAKAPDLAGLRSFKRRSISGEPRQGEIIFPHETFFTPGLSESGTVELGISFVCWLMADEIKAKLRAMLEAAAEGREGVSVNERRAVDAKLRADLLAEHRIESRICHELREQGVAFEWNRLHPLAFLEMEMIEPDAPPASQHQHWEIDTPIPSYPVPPAPKGTATK